MKCSQACRRHSFLLLIDYLTISRRCTNWSFYRVDDPPFAFNKCWSIMSVIPVRRLEWVFPLRSTKVTGVKSSISGENLSGNDWRQLIFFLSIFISFQEVGAWWLAENTSDTHSTVSTLLVVLLQRISFCWSLRKWTSVLDVLREVSLVFTSRLNVARG